MNPIKLSAVCFKQPTPYIVGNGRRETNSSVEATETLQLTCESPFVVIRVPNDKPQGIPLSSVLFVRYADER